MRFGVHGFNFGRVAGDIPTLLRLVSRADELGWDSVWVGDHILIPRNIASPYPYSPTGTAPFKLDEPALEPLALLSYLAGSTSRVRLGISVLIVPHRNPLYAAKVLSTLDVLSGGRVICGVGAGWMREEFDTLGLDFDRRATLRLFRCPKQPYPVVGGRVDGPAGGWTGTDHPPEREPPRQCTGADHYWSPCLLWHVQRCISSQGRARRGRGISVASSAV